MQRLSVKHLLSTAIVAFALLEGAAVGAAELPTYEVSSFPATPHQLEVLTPRHGTVRAANAGTVGAAQ